MPPAGSTFTVKCHWPGSTTVKFRWLAVLFMVKCHQLVVLHCGMPPAGCTFYSEMQPANSNFYIELLHADNNFVCEMR